MSIATPPKTGKGHTQHGLTIADLAAGVGVSETSIKSYIARGCPRDSVDAVKKWRMENIRTFAEVTADDDLPKERLRAEAAERWENVRTRQLKNDVLEGRLIEKAKVETQLAINLTRLRNRLTSLPTEIAMLCPDDLKVPMKAKVEQVIAVAFKEIVDAIKDGDEEEE